MPVVEPQGNAQIWVSAFIIGLSSFLFGYGMSSFNSIMVTGDSSIDSEQCFNGEAQCPVGSVFNDLDLNTSQQQLITTMTILGATIGCLFASFFSDILGRKGGLLTNNIFFIVGGAMCGLTNVNVVLGGRLLVGLGVGIESSIAPVLLSEIATPKLSGALTSIHQLMCTIGILAAALLGFGFTQIDSGWKYVQWFTMIPAILQCIFFQLVPESPKWLIKHGKADAALKCLTGIRSGELSDIQEELDQMITAQTNSDAANKIPPKMELSINEQKEKVEEDNGASWSEVFKFKKAMAIGMLMMFFSAMTGINSIIFYSTTIFTFAGVQEPIIGTVAVGVLNVILTIISGYLVDKTGRKLLLTSGTWLMLFSLITLGLLLKVGPDTQLIGYLDGLFVLTYVCGFAVGLGAVQWVVLSEVVPTRIRAKAYSLFTLSNWAANLIISLFTLTVINTLGGVSKNDSEDVKTTHLKNGVSYLYFIFAGMCVLCLIFLYGLVPETKGRNPDDEMESPTSPINASNQRRKGSVERGLLEEEDDDRYIATEKTDYVNQKMDQRI